MQQPGPMFPVMPSFPPTNITTEQIQKYLDENKKLILAILDNQNLGKLAECAQYQAQLQKNLMYLAAIADAQPQTTPAAMAAPPQMSPHHPAIMQQGGGGFYLQHQHHHPQAIAMAQQPGLFSPPRVPPPHPQMQDLQHHHHLAPQVQMTPPRPIGNGSSHNETNLGTSSSLPTSNMGINKQDKPDGSGSNAHGGGSGGTGGDGEEGK
ncbi:hypothetical protein RD792_004474 [Penstemon davidsonii]|uniref:SS18 N-terminal domain-containing protein n=1 Tax=Penstemon davidsonii TaxID=160366 RepID=A0ABR0DHI4_9LAMI|nr:hypothetical protein RD792_004474 [Penstemon davidsonii]